MSPVFDPAPGHVTAQVPFADAHDTERVVADATPFTMPLLG